jgi:hypothetical protein
METAILQQYNEYTRYLRPYTPVTFSDREMVNAVLEFVDAPDVASITQLLGDRKGVIRVTLQTVAGITRLEESVKQRRLDIKGVPLGLVPETGQFFILTLDNVPNFISEEQVEEVMGQFGVIAGVLRDYLEYRSKRIESEKRRILYTTYFKPDAIPRTVDICGIQVFVVAHSAQKSDSTSGKENGRRSTSSSHSKPEKPKELVIVKKKPQNEELKKLKEHPAIR